MAKNIFFRNNRMFQNDLEKFNDAGDLVNTAGGGGGGNGALGINYLTNNPDAESGDTTGWTIYNNQGFTAPSSSYSQNIEWKASGNSNWVSRTSHGLALNDRVVITNGTLPPTIFQDIVYYVSRVIDVNTFTLSTTLGGVPIDYPTNFTALIDMVKIDFYRGTNFVNYGGAVATTPYVGSNFSWTVENNLSAVIRHQNSFKLTKSGAGISGLGVVSNDFPVEIADYGNSMYVKFDYYMSYLLPAGQIQPGDFFEVYIYDVTNGQIIPVTPMESVGTSVGTANQRKYYGTFMASSNASSYRMAIHWIDPSTKDITFIVDDFQVGPEDSIKFASPITDWQAYTPTLEFMPTGSTGTFQWRRVGNCVEIEGNISVGSSGGPYTQSFTIGGPPGLHLNGSGYRFLAKPYHLLDPGVAWDEANVTSTIPYFWRDDITFSIMASKVTGTSGSNMWTWHNIAGQYPVTWSAGGWGISISASFQVVGWGSNVQMTTIDVGRPVFAKYELTSDYTYTSSSSTGVNFDRKIYDSHNAVHVGSDWKFTAPVEGLYRVSAFMANSSAPSEYALFKNYYRSLGTDQYVGKITGYLTPSQRGGASTTVYLERGDFISVGGDDGVLLGAAGNPIGMSACSISIEKIGSNAIAISDGTLAGTTMDDRQDGGPLQMTSNHIRNQMFRPGPAGLVILLPSAKIVPGDTFRFTCGNAGYNSQLSINTFALSEHISYINPFCWAEYTALVSNPTSAGDWLESGRGGILEGTIFDPRTDAGPVQLTANDARHQIFRPGASGFTVALPSPRLMRGDTFRITCGNAGYLTPITVNTYGSSEHIAYIPSGCWAEYTTMYDAPGSASHWIETARGGKIFCKYVMNPSTSNKTVFNGVQNGLIYDVWEVDTARAVSNYYSAGSQTVFTAPRSGYYKVTAALYDSLFNDNIAPFNWRLYLVASTGERKMLGVAYEQQGGNLPNFWFHGSASLYLAEGQNVAPYFYFFQAANHTLYSMESNVAYYPQTNFFIVESVD